MDHRVLHGDCLTVMQGLPDNSVSVSLCSPPYEDSRTYGIGFKLKGQEWVDWLAPRIVEACRVTEGLVFVVMSCRVRKWKYSAAVEWLVADLTRKHGITCGPAPYVFHRVGIPGSGSKHYHRRDWEPVYGFADPAKLPVKWSANTEMGRPPKWAPGGAMSNRTRSGNRLVRGNFKASPRKPFPKIANPGNVIHLKVGGGLMGSGLAHETEAPFPVALAEFFIRSYCPPDGTVLDFFSGSGTTGDAAIRWGRKFLGIEIRESQVELTKRRLQESLCNKAGSE